MIGPTLEAEKTGGGVDTIVPSLGIVIANNCSLSMPPHCRVGSKVSVSL
jgi:hypothetical protein